MSRLTRGLYAFIVSSLLVVPSLAYAQSSEEPSGADVFSSVCAACHQGSGRGIAGAFPPLADHLSDLMRAEGGRSYVISAVVFGLQGEIEVEGVTYNGLMPAHPQLSDETVAAVLNHVVTELSEEAVPEEFEPVTAEEVADVRTMDLTPSQVHERRPEPVQEDEEEAAGELVPPTFTVAQAERVNEVYQDRCSECHGESLAGGVVGGPPLRGSYFDQRWAGRTVGALFEYTRARMPQDRPGSLTDQTYADLVALILHTNGISASGSELPADAEALQRFVIPE